VSNLHTHCVSPMACVPWPVSRGLPYLPMSLPLPQCFKMFSCLPHLFMRSSKTESWILCSSFLSSLPGTWTAL
jgi:hypothetical protein